MDDIKEVVKRFEKNLSDIYSMVSIGSEIEDISLLYLTQFKDSFFEATEGEGYIPLKQQLTRSIKNLKKLKGHPKLKRSYEIIYNQALVLIVGNFESLMNDLFRTIINNHFYLINWDSKKTIKIDTDLFKYSSSADVGGMLLPAFKQEINFQDLKSTLRFLENYLNINTNFLKKEKKDDIILFQALRHVIIHSSSKVDHQFMKQVSDTVHKNKYSIGEKVSLSEKEYVKAKDTFNKFAVQIQSSILLKEIELLK